MNTNRITHKAKNSIHRQLSIDSAKDQIHAFTLIELLVSIIIVGILSTTALPNYLNQVNRSRQNEAATTINQIQTTIAAYADEFGILPENWTELNEVSAVMTDEGPAKADNFGGITLAGGFYIVDISQDQNNLNLFTITATREETPNLNIIACINLTNGASGINKGTTNEAALAPICS